MALVTTTEMFKRALNADYAVGAFNVNNMKIIQGIVDAAQAEDAPLILQVSAGARKYAKPIYLTKLVEAAMHTIVPMDNYIFEGLNIKQKLSTFRAACNVEEGRYYKDFKDFVVDVKGQYPLKAKNNNNGQARFLPPPSAG